MERIQIIPDGYRLREVTRLDGWVRIEAAKTERPEGGDIERVEQRRSDDATPTLAVVDLSVGRTGGYPSPCRSTLPGLGDLERAGCRLLPRLGNKPTGSRRPHA